jgi:hypothetical protein
MRSKSMMLSSQCTIGMSPASGGANEQDRGDGLGGDGAGGGGEGVGGVDGVEGGDGGGGGRRRFIGVGITRYPQARVGLGGV